MPVKDRNAWQLTLRVLLWLVDQWFIIGMGVAVALASQFPNVARDGGVIRAQYSISYGAVAVIFLLSGLGISTKVLVEMASRWQAHVVTQALSFLVTPAIMFGIAEAIRAAGNPAMDPYVLVGMIITGVTPTTVSSNVVMTKQADGNDSLCVIEVTVGNLLGAFISPALAQLYLRDSTGFGYGNPAMGGDVKQLYGRVMKQLGLAVFIPLAVGQIVQNLFPKPVKTLLTTYKLSKLGSVCMLLLIWSTFSTAFYQNAFTEVPHATIIMVCFVNVGLYLFFTVICFAAARCIPVYRLAKPVPSSSRLYHATYALLSGFYFDRRDTVAIMLAGAAKTVALGVPLVQSQYGLDNPLVGKVSVPLVLYQGEQILTAQFLIPVFRRWIHAEKKKDEEEPVPMVDKIKGAGTNEVSK